MGSDRWGTQIYPGPNAASVSLEPSVDRYCSSALAAYSSQLADGGCSLMDGFLDNQPHIILGLEERRKKKEGDGKGEGKLANNLSPPITITNYIFNSSHMVSPHQQDKKIMKSLSPVINVLGIFAEY